MKKSINYKKLILSTEGIMFDTNCFKIYELDQDHVNEFLDVYHGIIKEENSFIGKLVEERNKNEY